MFKDLEFRALPSCFFGAKPLRMTFGSPNFGESALKHCMGGPAIPGTHLLH